MKPRSFEEGTAGARGAEAARATCTAVRQLSCSDALNCGLGVANARNPRNRPTRCKPRAVVAWWRQQTLVRAALPPDRGRWREDAGPPWRLLVAPVGAIFGGTTMAAARVVVRHAAAALSRHGGDGVSGDGEWSAPLRAVRGVRLLNSRVPTVQLQE